MPSEKPDIIELNKWFKLAEDAHTPWKKQAQEDLRFVVGKQWSSEDLRILKDQRRPALTFNHILPLVNLVSGYQRQNRQDIKVHNKKDGTREVAEILTAIIKDVHDNSTGDFEVSMAFLLGLITAKGFLGVNIDYDNDPYNGELRIESHSPFRCYPDPFHERYDLSDAMFFFTTAWLPKRRIELSYPEKKKELEGMETESDDRMLYSESSTSSDEDTYAEGEGTSGAHGLSDVDKYKYRVKQCWRREFEVETFLYDLVSGKAKLVDLPAEKIKNILKRAPNWRKIKRVTPRVHLNTYVGNVMLQEIEPYVDTKNKQYGLRNFPIVPFYAYWFENQFLSIVTPLKDPQQEINKRYSQLLHHLNMSSNSGWIGDSDAVQDWDELEQFGSRPGITIKKKRGSQLERIQPSVLSEGHLVLAREGINQIRHVSGIDPSLMGIVPERGKESGIALQLRQRQGITVLEPVLDNFRITKQLLGKVLIEMIQKSGAYSREEILRLVIDGEEKEFAINQRQKRFGFATGRILNDMSVGRYGCTVAQQPSNPTIRLANFYSLLEALKVGLPIPPDVVIKASDIPEKDAILEGIQKQQEAQAQAAQAKLKLDQDKLNLEAKKIEIEGSIKLAQAENKGGSK